MKKTATQEQTNVSSKFAVGAAMDRLNVLCKVSLPAISLFLIIGSLANAQTVSTAPPPSHDVEMKIDSGMVNNDCSQCESAWAETIEIEGAKWLQIHFSEVILTKGRKVESTIKITSLEDGAFQILDSESQEQWQHKSAYFNGDAVKVELIAHPEAVENCVAIKRVTVGDVADQSKAESICDDVDNRSRSFDSRVARVDIGCTAWLFDDRFNDLITAGHCAASMQAVFFNVPLSDSDGTVNFPSPDDQYAICRDSIQFVNAGVGEDWCYFGVFNNSNTGLSPLAAQGRSYDIARPNSRTFSSNDSIRITGFGSNSFPANPRLNQAQTTHTGNFAGLVGDVLRYRPDTTGGNSGGPILNATSTTAYGVHTHGGCFNGGGFNQGTGFNDDALWNALDNPRGVCLIARRPVNDFCEDAIEIGNGTIEFDTTRATLGGGSRYDFLHRHNSSSRVRRWIWRVAR